jgi:hypothetical protein
MTIDELFEMVSEVVARPKTEITREHKLKTIIIFTYFSKFMLVNDLEYYKNPRVDFTSYASKIFDEIEGK